MSVPAPGYSRSVTELLVRAAGARVFERGASLFVMDPRGAVRRLDGDSAALAKAVLSLLEIARTRGELLTALAALVGGPVEPVSVVDELLSLLRQSGAVLLGAREGAALHTSSRGARGMRVVLGVTGAVQSIHTPWLVALLLSEGHEVRVAMTENALRFCRPEGLEALTHSAVRTSLWGADSSGPAPHIQLAEWADLMVIAPASASTVAKLAAGSCEDVVSATAIATRAPVVLAPSMNVAMADAPSVRRNVETLIEDGFIVVHPTTGHEVAHAPGERTPMRGTMPNPPEFVAILRAVIATAPPRREPIAASLATSWDERYRDPIETRPWDGEALDEGLQACVERVCAGRSSLRALDLGCGSGLLAVALARLGCAVTAVDLSERALAMGREREGGERVRWLCADVMSATLAGRFDFVCDRALLHVLAPSAQRTYAQRVARWLADGGAMVLTAHDEHAPSELGTTRFTVKMVAELFDGLLELESVERCAMRGPAGQSVSARRYVLKKV